MTQAFVSLTGAQWAAGRKSPRPATHKGCDPFCEIVIGEVLK